MCGSSGFDICNPLACTPASDRVRLQQVLGNQSTSSSQHLLALTLPDPAEHHQHWRIAPWPCRWRALMLDMHVLRSEPVHPTVY